MLEFTKADPETFDFKVSGKVYRVPLLDQFPADANDDLMEAIASAGTDQQALLALNRRVYEIFDKHAPGVRSKLTQRQFTELGNAYIEASKVTAGE